MAKRNKLSKPHTTFIPTADKIRRFMMDLPEVNKISSGVIISIGSGPIGVKIQQESGAILLQIRGNSAIQDVRIYSTDHDKTLVALKQFISDQKWRIS